METTSIHTDFELCYRALCSRDARFDGRFFTAVTSTGIYCRPVCPAPTPQARNVRFYPCAAAAVSAGFRACRRCHPEASPGSPDWNVRADLVARALRLIAEGIVDSEGVAGLAERLAVSERHLYRELMAEVGAAPLALARSRRAQTARLLIDQTDLTLTTIAFAAGFASIRQFNETMQEAFGCAPSALRRRVKTGSTGDGRLTLRLQYRPPFDVEAVLNYLAQRAVPGVEEVSAGSYRRTIMFARSKGMLEIEPVAGMHAVAVHLQLDDLSDLSLIVQRCRQLFDLDADPAMIASVLATDPLLAPLVEARPGLRVPGAINGFEVAVRALLSQNCSAAGARSLIKRVVKAFGEPLQEARGTLTHFFPTPQQIVQADLQAAGVGQIRAATLKQLACAVLEEELVLERDAEREQTLAHVHRLAGVGPATVRIIATQALGDPDSFAGSSHTLRQTFEEHGLPSDAVSIEHHAESWRPWRAYALQYLLT